MLDANTTRVVRKLSDIYDFPLDQALERLCLGPEVPPAPKRKKTAKPPAFPLPFCGQTMPGRCHGIRFNKGLFTQCVNPPIQSPIDTSQTKCSTCLNTSRRSVCCGDVTTRSQAGWTDTKGRRPVPYHSVMGKLGVTREAAEAAAASLGWTIPEQEFTPAQPARRGRPPKVKPLVSTSRGNDMLDALVDGARKMSLSDPDPQTDPVPKDLPKSENMKDKFQRLFGSDSDDEDNNAAYDAETDSDHELEAVPATPAFIDGIEYLFDKATHTAYDLETQNKVGVRKADGSGWAYVTDWAHDSMLASGLIS